MRPLQFSRYLLSLLCIYPPEDPSSKWILFRKRLFGILTALHLFLAAAAASYKYFVVDFESATYEFPECVAVSMSNYTFIMGFISQKEIREMFDLFQGIYDICESSQYSISERFIYNFIFAHQTKKNINQKALLTAKLTKHHKSFINITDNLEKCTKRKT